MTTLQEAAMCKALEYAEAQCGGRCNAEYNPCWAQEVADALRAALAQQGKQFTTRELIQMNEEYRASINPVTRLYDPEAAPAPQPAMAMNLPPPKLPHHRHRLLIILWAEGYPIEFLTPDDGWVHLANPAWLSNGTYSARLENSRIISSPNGVSFEPSPPQP